jgi:Fe(3+) dicitrate transport protein
MSLPCFTVLRCALPEQKNSKYKKTIATGLLCSVFMGMTLPAYAQNDPASLKQTFNWNIPSQSLDVSIIDLATRAGLAIILEPGQLKGVNANALHGEMPVKDALTILLKGSGYRYEVGTDNRLVLRVLSAPLSMVQPEPIMIVGDWLNNATKETEQNFPGARHKITQDDFEKVGAVSLTEAFRKIPGMQVRVPAESYGANHALSVGVRGLKSRFSEKSTILLDGMPVSFAPYGQPQLSIAPIALGNLAAIDVVKGGSSVRYGPQNVGGVINFVTPDIPQELTTRLKMHAEGATQGEKGILGQTNAFIGGAISEDTRMALMYSGSHGSGYRENSDEDIDDIMLKAETWITDSEKLEGHLRYFDAKTEISGGLNETLYEADRYQSRFDFNHFDGDRKEGRIKYTNYLSDTQEFEMQAFAANTYRLYGLQFNPDSRQRYDEWGREYDVFGVEPRYSQLFDFGSTAHEISVGYRYIKETADLTRYRWNNFAVGSDPRSVNGVLRTKDEAGTTAHAAYIDDRILFGEWAITPGVRLEKVKVFRDSLVSRNAPNNFHNDESYTELLPSLSVGYQLSPSLTLFSNYSTSFGTLQHLQLSDSTDNNLEPEIARTVEVGGRYQQGGLSAEVILFNINFNNKLQWDDSLGYHVNRGRTRHYGAELGAGYDIADTGLSLHGNLSYTKAKFKEGNLFGNELPYYSNWVGNLGVQYQRNNWTYNLEGYAQSKQFSDNENTDGLTVVNDTFYRGHLPGFAIWNVRTSYQTRDNSRISFGVKNIFNKDYYSLSGPDQPYGSGISAGAPMTAFVELEMEF